MTPALESHLIDRFPWLFAHNADWPDKGVTEHYPILCGDGWFSLVERTCLTLAEVESRYRGFGCTEQWLPRAAIYTDDTTGHEGLLRFDLTDGPVRNDAVLTRSGHRSILVSGMTWMACDVSRTICEVCGNPGRRAHKRVRCAAHIQVSTRDAQTDAAHGVAQLIQRATNPEGTATFTVLPTKKRPPRA